MGVAQTWLIANWKMNGEASRVRAWASAVNAALSTTDHAVNVVFCPPSIYLEDARAVLPVNARVMLGAQNCHAEAKGAFTGEISAPMLIDKGCAYVIVGHSECRLKGDCDETVAGKAVGAIAAGLTPIICIGESLAHYEANETLKMLDMQLEAIAALPIGSYLVAYEPIWAIGSGRTPTTAQIQVAHRHIKSVLGSSANVLYGGSVNASNVTEILALPEVSGALVGGASLESNSMCALITSAANIRLGK